MATATGSNGSAHLSHHIIITIAVIVGIIVFNLTLLFILWIIQRCRRSRAEDKQLTMRSDDSFASMQSNFIETPSVSYQSQVPPYMQTTKALQNSSTSLVSVPLPITPPITRTPAPASLQTPPKAYTRLEVRGQMQGAELRRSSARRTMRQRQNAPPRMRRGPLLRIVSLKRNNSIDSASIYSVASAPGDAHEYMFQSMALGPTPTSAPAHATTHAVAATLQSNTQPLYRTSTHTHKALAPETYTKPLPPKPLSPRLRPVSAFQRIPKVPLMSEHPPIMRLPSTTFPLKHHTPPSSFRPPTHIEI